MVYIIIILNSLILRMTWIKLPDKQYHQNYPQKGDMNSWNIYHMKTVFYYSF